MLKLQRGYGFHWIVVALIFTYLPEGQIKKKIYLYIQTNSLTIFTCLNPVLLFGQVG